MSYKSQFAEANRNLPLKAIIINAGYAPANIKYNEAFDCLFCKGSRCAFVFIALPGESELFKCFNDSCPRDNDVLNAIEFIAAVRQISKDAAVQIYFMEARIYAQKHRLGDEPLIEKCIEFIRHQHTEIVYLQRHASIAEFQRQFQIGFKRATRVMKILEERGIVGPYQPRPAREILKLPDLPPPPPPAAEATSVSANDAVESQAPAIDPTTPEQASQTTGVEPAINSEIVGQCEPKTTRDIVKLPDLPATPPPTEQPATVAINHNAGKSLTQPVEPTTLEQAKQPTGAEPQVSTGISVETSVEQ